MSKKVFLLLKSLVWETLSNLLGFAVTWIITGQLGVSVTITLILLVVKSVLLAIYDHHITIISKRVLHE
jgi:uncharacterized membrane protein